MGSNRPGRVLSVSVLPAVLLFAPLAWAGRLHPDLEAQRGALPCGGTVSVIVELADRADPHAAALRHGDRRGRGRAVVDALRDKANRSQGAIRAYLARKAAAGRVHRQRPFWVLNGVAVTAEAGVICALAARPDVLEVRPDRTIPRPAPVPAAMILASELSEWNRVTSSTCTG